MKPFLTFKIMQIHCLTFIRTQQLSFQYPSFQMPFIADYSGHTAVMLRTPTSIGRT